MIFVVKYINMLFRELKPKLKIQRLGLCRSLLLGMGVVFGLFGLIINVQAADRYWVGGGASANWNATGPTNWATSSGGANNAAVPGAADDVFFDGVGGGNSSSTLSASITINSLNMTGYANTLTHNALDLTIDSQDGSGNSLIMGAGMTYTHNDSARIIFTGTGTSKITTNGKSMGKIAFNNSGGTFQLQDNYTSDSSGVSLVETMILAVGTFDPNSKTVTLTGTTPWLRGSFTFYNLTRTGTTAKTDTLTLVNNITVSNTFTVNGNSTTSRVLVQSDTLGTQRTLTAGTTSISNADFQDIKKS